MGVLQRIFAHARLTPGRPALTHNGRRFSYGAFAAMVVATRGVLEAQDVPSGRIAVLCLRDVLSAWIVGLALRSLGVTTVIVRTPQDIARLDLGAVSVVSNATELAHWPGLEASATQMGAKLVSAPKDVRALAIEAGDLDLGDGPFGANILLTSGTTGEFKKVLIDAAAEDSVAASNAELAHITGAMTLHVFDFGGWTAAGFFWPVCAWSLGGEVALWQGPAAWRSLAEAEPGRPHMAFATPQMIGALLGAPAEAALPNDALRLVAVGGVLSAAQWADARSRLTRDLWSIYGATETSLMSFTPLETADDLQWHRINATCDLQVVDDADQPAPVGQVGVVRARPTRVDGYMNDPEATRIFFRHGYFYPGDLGVMDADRRLRLHGRVTDVINVLGNKAGALPIETALQAALGVEAVCVFSTPGADGEEVHVALQTDRTIGLAELKTALAAALPAQTPQVRVHWVRAFPRNHMGKVERAVLMAQLGLQPPNG